MERVITTNCWVYKDDKILLGLKKRGFGAGRWNGFGGKPNTGETLQQAAVRELKEECGIIPTDIEHVGLMEFEYQGKEKIYEVNIFKVTDFTGEPIESEEMQPQWFPANALPFADMWPDDQHWMPLFLAGKKWRGKFLYEGYDTILKFSLNEV